MGKYTPAIGIRNVEKREYITISMDRFEALVSLQHAVQSKDSERAESLLKEIRKIEGRDFIRESAEETA